MKEINNKEIKDRLLDRYIANLTMAKNLIDVIIPVVEKFDGKVYNKRFDNALKEILEQSKEQTEGKQVYCSVDLDYRRLYIKLEFYNHRAVSAPNSWEYIPNGYEEVHIFYHWTNYSMWDNEGNKKYYEKDNGEYFYIDNGNTRLCSAPIVSGMREKQKEIEDKIEELLKAKETVVEVYNKVEDLKAQLSEIHDTIPHIVGNIYGITSYGNYIA